MKSGTLYIVSTPIGNLTDISIRAIDTIKSVDLLLSEDTRETQKLLNKFKISVKQKSYRDQNHNLIVKEIITILKNGLNVALVSDSGTPVISDPGFKLVNSAIKNDIKVSSVPGPSAVVAALSISGIPSDKFTFLGFLPKKELQIKKIVEPYSNLDTTLIIFESPYRVLKTIEILQKILGDRVCSVVKEMTKVHEETFYGTLSTVSKKITKPKLKGEFVILVAKKNFKG